MTISLARRIAAVGTTLLLAGCSATVVDGSGSQAKPGQAGSVGLSVRWKTKVGGGIGADQLAGGAADRSRVYVNSDSGHVFALNAATGKVVWDAQPGTRTGTPLGAAGGVVFYYDTDAGLTTLDAATGRALWKGDQLGGNSDFATRPAYLDGVVVLPAEKGYEEGLGGRDVRTGKLRWLAHYEDYIDNEVAPVVAGGLFFGVRQPLNGNGAPSLLALSPKTGKAVWTGELTGIQHYDEITLATTGDAVLVASQHDSNSPVSLSAFDVRTHARKWTTAVPDVHLGGSDALGASAGGTFVFGTVKGLKGVSLSTGKLVYTKRLDGGPAERPGLCGGQVCAVGIQVLTVVNASGTTIGEFHEPDDPQSASAEPMPVSAGKTYLVNDSYVYGLG